VRPSGVRTKTPRSRRLQTLASMLESLSARFANPRGSPVDARAQK
jgi:hypothetical protein